MLGQAIAVVCVLIHHVKQRQDLRNPAFYPGDDLPADLSAPLSRIIARRIPDGAAHASDLWDGLEAGIVAAGWTGEQFILDAQFRGAVAGAGFPQGPPAAPEGEQRAAAAAPGAGWFGGGQPPAETPPAPAPSSSAAPAELRGNVVVADPTPSPVGAALAAVPTRR